MTPDDEELEQLVLRAQRGDDDAKEQLFRRCLPVLQSWVQSRHQTTHGAHEAASDLVQSACREALDHLHTFAPRRDATFRGWLLTVLGNKALEKLRRGRAQKRDTRRELRDPSFELDALPASLATPSQVLLGREGTERLERAIDTLSEEQREVLLWSRFAGLPHREIAARTGRTEVAVRSLLSRALARLATALERDGRP